MRYTLSEKEQKHGRSSVGATENLASKCACGGKQTALEVLSPPQFVYSALAPEVLTISAHLTLSVLMIAA